MKKMLTILLSLSTLLAVSCSKEKPNTTPDGKGKIVLNSNLAAIDAERYVTRSNPDISSFILTLNGNAITWPEDDTITDVDAGTYTVAIKSAATPPAPGFEAPYYYGEKQVTVTDGQPATAEIIIDLKNASVKFDYTALVGTEFEGLIPVVKQNTTTLRFENENKAKAGYFEVGETNEIEISLQNAGGEVVPLGGKESQKLKWNKINYALTVELTVSAGGSGSIGIDVDFAPIQEETITWKVGNDGDEPEPDPDEDKYTVLTGEAGAIFVSRNERFMVQISGTHNDTPFTFQLDGHAPDTDDLLVGEYTVDQEIFEDGDYYYLAEGDDDGELIGSYILFGTPYAWDGTVYYFEDGTVSITKQGANYVIKTKVSGSTEDQSVNDWDDFSGEDGMFKFVGPIDITFE